MSEKLFHESNPILDGSGFCVVNMLLIWLSSDKAVACSNLSIDNKKVGLIVPWEWVWHKTWDSSMFLILFEFVWAHWTEQFISSRASLFSSNPNDQWILLPIISGFEEHIIHILFLNDFTITFFLKHYILHWEVAWIHYVVFQLHGLWCGVDINTLSNVLCIIATLALTNAVEELHDVAKVEVVKVGSLCDGY